MVPEGLTCRVSPGSLRRLTILTLFCRFLCMRNSESCGRWPQLLAGGLNLECLWPVLRS